MSLRDLPQLKAAADMLATETHVIFCDRIVDEIENIESPLERDFYLWWEALRNPSGEFADAMHWILLSPQYELKIRDKRYRADFILTFEDDEISRASAWCPTFPKIIIELDGHEFHERTKEQVIYRDTRDRDIQSAGFLVLHLSGSGFYRDPEGSVRGIMRICSDAAWRWIEEFCNEKIQQARSGDIEQSR